MMPTLNEGVGMDMAMLKVFKRYFKLKNEMNEIEETVKQYGFKSVEECLVLVVIVESEQTTSVQIQSNTSLEQSTISTIARRLAISKLIQKKDDETDSKHRVLRRQIYTPTAKGIDLVAKLKSQLQ